MCNLYRVYTSQEEIRGATNAMIDSVGNMEPEIEVWPDRMGPIVRNTPAGRELAMVRWGMPSSSQAIFQNAKKRAEKLEAKGKPVDFPELLKMEPDGGTTNVRNTSSKHWTLAGRREPLRGADDALCRARSGQQGRRRAHPKRLVCEE